MIGLTLVVNSIAVNFRSVAIHILVFLLLLSKISNVFAVADYSSCGCFSLFPGSRTAYLKNR